MKKVLIIMLVLLLPSAAFAGNVYFGVSGGTTMTSEQEFDIDDGTQEDFELDLGYNVGAQLGYDFGDYRAAFEYAYRESEFDNVESNALPGIEIDFSDGSLNIHSFMAAAYYDFHNKSNLTPYIGMGLGVAHISIDELQILGITTVDDSETVFAYKFEAGAGYKVATNISLTAAYEYFATAEAEFENEGVPPLGADATINNHNFKFGMRYAF